MSAQPILDIDPPETIYGTLQPDGRRWCIDAEPFVMGRARALFPGALKGIKGERTHQTLEIAPSPVAAKDLLWLMLRYPLFVNPALLEKLHYLGRMHDNAVAAAAKGDSNTLFTLGMDALQMAEPPRDHQTGFRNLARDVKRILLADELGLGKTISAIALLCDKESRPACIVVPTHLTRQWEKQIRRFLPGASTHIIHGRRPYKLPEVDVVITAYTRLQGWQDTLIPWGPRLTVFDEIQDLRHIGTQKRGVARALSEQAQMSVGLSATPIYNYGAEIWSVMDVIAPDALGPSDDFNREWCGSAGVVRQPKALHSYLAMRGLMLRRTRQTLGIQADPVTREVITLEGDLESLKHAQDQAKALALSVLSNIVGQSDRSARQLDWLLRQATGIAKAKAVAEFVKLLAEEGEKVLLVGWHRAVYEIWTKELRNLKPVMYTGSESPAQKAASVKAFCQSQVSKVFICSLRSGQGLDGLQHACNHVVFGELDWSPQVMEQVIGRLDREGQAKPVSAYFLTIDDGADPFMISVLGDKQSQSDGVVAGIEGRADILDAQATSDRIRQMAEAYLALIGEAPPIQELATGLLREVADALRMLSLPSSTEREMQEALWSVLPGMLPNAKVQREVRFSERGRLDFIVCRDGERIAIECKTDQTGRPAVYRQVRRYAEEAAITGLVLLAPWSGVSNFQVEETPVIVVDYSKQSLRRGSK